MRSSSRMRHQRQKPPSALGHPVSFCRLDRIFYELLPSTNPSGPDTRAPSNTIHPAPPSPPISTYPSPQKSPQYRSPSSALFPPPTTSPQSSSPCTAKTNSLSPRNPNNGVRHPQTSARPSIPNPPPRSRHSPSSPPQIPTPPSPSSTPTSPFPSPARYPPAHPRST